LSGSDCGDVPIETQHTESWFRGKGNARLYQQSWAPNHDPRAVLVIVHGLFEHSGRYGHLVRSLAPRGFAVTSFDLRGHGKSEGLRGYVNHFEDFVDDLAVFRKAVDLRYPGKPLFLFGHSIGGTIAVAYAAGHQRGVAGCILSAAVAKPGSSVTSVSIAVARVMSAVFPRMGVAFVDALALSRDESVVAAYMNDPLVYRGRIRARLGAELINTVERTLPSQMALIELPVLVLQGSEDRLSNVASSDLIFESVKSRDKTLKRYDGFYHEILNEPGREQVLVDIGEWLDRHP
jgi:acylglycerol lipase